MQASPDVVEVLLLGSQIVGCKHCGGVARFSRASEGKVLFIADHQRSGDWGHGAYQSPRHIEEVLSMRVQQELDLVGEGFRSISQL
jgi:hypothetical protein